MKYIDAERLQANIKEIENEFKTGNYYLDNSEQAVGYYNALMDFERLIDSLQQEQPSLPDNLDEAAENMYPTTTTPPTPGEISAYFNAAALKLRDAFKAGAEWMAKKEE